MALFDFMNNQAFGTGLNGWQLAGLALSNAVNPEGTQSVVPQIQQNRFKAAQVQQQLAEAMMTQQYRNAQLGIQRENAISEEAWRKALQLRWVEDRKAEAAKAAANNRWDYVQKWAADTNNPITPNIAGWADSGGDVLPTFNMEGQPGSPSWNRVRMRDIQGANTNSLINQRDFNQQFALTYRGPYMQAQANALNTLTPARVGQIESQTALNNQRYDQGEQRFPWELKMLGSRLETEARRRWLMGVQGQMLPRMMGVREGQLGVAQGQLGLAQQYLPYRKAGAVGLGVDPSVDGVTLNMFGTDGDYPAATPAIPLAPRGNGGMASPYGWADLMYNNGLDPSVPKEEAVKLAGDMINKYGLIEPTQFGTFNFPKKQEAVRSHIKRYMQNRGKSKGSAGKGGKGIAPLVP